MKKLSLALAAAGALSLGLASSAQAGEGGIAAGAAATFSETGEVQSLSVAASVGKSGAAVSVRSGRTSVLVQEPITETVPILFGPIGDQQIVGEEVNVVGFQPVLLESEGIVNEAYAIGTGGVITANRIGDATTTTDEGGISSTPLPVFEETGDPFLATPQANEIGSGTASFVVFDPATGDVVLVEGNGFGN
ncbi:MAG: hypothetical protein VKJ86_10655 [Synechococcus sp.]|nr:hypothetical protein [Synechococcus sp.]